MYLNKRAFTLIELLVVVLIIGILAAVAVPQYEKAVEKARAAEAMIILKNIAEANQRYYLANGEYTWSLADLDINIPGKNITELEMDRKVTKYFRYGARRTSKTDTSGTIAIAIRASSGDKYVLSIFSDSPTPYCEVYHTKNLAFCKMLGATGATEPYKDYPISM